MADRDEHAMMPDWDASMLAAERERRGPSSTEADALLARLQRSMAAIDAGSSAEAELDPPGAPSAEAAGGVTTWLGSPVLRAALTYLVGFASGALAHDRVTRASREQTRSSAAIIAAIANDAESDRSSAHVAPVADAYDAGGSRVLRIGEGLPRRELSRTATAAASSEAVDRGAESSSSSSARALREPRPEVDGGARASATDASIHEGESTSDDLIVETNLIEMARSALARGRAQSALDALERHRAQFAAGQLAEDRESLAVEALVTLGRNDDARRRADAFRRRWPNGIYGPRVDAAIALIR